MRLSNTLQDALPDPIEVHRKPTFMAAYRVLLDWEEAKDVTQETFLALCRQQPPVAEARTRQWLKTVAVNKAIDRKRRQGRSRVEFRDSVPEVPSSGPPEPVHDLIGEEARELTRRALLLLPERQRQVLTMRVMEDMRFVDLAAQLGISDGAAKTHFRRGLSTLAHLLRNLRDTDQENNHG
jgi:RNA polymerase sigma-70 factor (ECF subfamily)